MISFSRLSVLATIVVALAVNKSQAIDQKTTCFKAGLQADCSSFINNFCNSLQDVQMNVGDANSRCYEASSTHHCEFTVYHKFATSAGTYSVSNCKAVLQNVTTSCPRGGSGRPLPNGGNLFTVNPDDGDCGTNSAPEENA